MQVCICSLAGTVACQNCANRPIPISTSTTYTAPLPNNWVPDESVIERIVRKVMKELVLKDREDISNGG